ncbi:MAG: cell division protein SepF [Firmicutes bacterium]|nr:cell division protein SepF [Bacillota bacterium]
MAGVFNKLAGVLGFANEAEDLEEDYDDFDDYGYEDDSDGFRSSYSGSDSQVTGFSDYNRRATSEPYRFGASSQQTQRTASAPRNYESSRPVNRSSYRSSQERGSKVVNLNANIQMEVIVSSPDSLDAAREIAEHIKLKKPVIINLERVEYKIAQRITDFLCGCCCAMNGNVQRIAEKIFMIAPDNVDFAGDMALQETLNQGDLGFLYGDR